MIRLNSYCKGYYVQLVCENCDTVVVAVRNRKKKINKEIEIKKSLYDYYNFKLKLSFEKLLSLVN